MGDKMFGCIGTTLLQSVHDPKSSDAQGYLFNTVHFLSTMAFGDLDWNLLLNTGEPDPKVYGDRPLRLFRLKLPRILPKHLPQSFDERFEYVRKNLEPVKPFSKKKLPLFFTSALKKDPDKASDKVPTSYDIPAGIRGLGNFSSRCSPVDVQGVVDYMRDPNLKKTLGWPLFSVWDCNCFHTSGYLMGKYAFDCAPSAKNKTIIVVNIDQHSDAGSVKQNYVSSDQWGYPLIKAFGRGAYVSLSTCAQDPGPETTVVESHVNQYKHGSFQGAKVSPFPRRSTSIEQWIQKKHLDGLISKEEEKRQESLEAISDHWKALLALLGSPAGFDYVFLTIDRDCMKDNFTQWGDGKSILNDYKHVDAVANAVLKTLTTNKKTKLVGFDVTGLPENCEYLKCNPCTKSRKALNIDKVLSSVSKELSTYYETFKKYR